MSKLPYSSTSALIAAFKAGTKFRVEGCQYGGDVISMIPDGRAVVATTVKGNTMYNPDGSRYFKEYPGVLVQADAPAPSDTLPFKTDAELFAAFQQGAKFEVHNTDGSVSPVSAIRLNNGQLRVTYVRPSKGAYTTGMLTARAGFKTSTRKLVMVSATATASKPEVAAPFLKRFVNGEPAYNPVTRETVIGVSFVKGAIEVLLKDEAGKERVSTQYDHEGRHRWVPARSLVLGVLPPPPKKKVELRIYEEAFWGAKRYVTLSPDQVLPNNGRHHTLVKTVEIDV